MNESQVLEAINKLSTQMEKAAGRPAGGGMGGAALLRGGPHDGPPPGTIIERNYGYNDRWRSSEWPTDQLKQLEGLYGSPAAVDLFARRRNGSLRVCGMGESLIKMVAMKGRNAASGLATREVYDQCVAKGIIPTDYDDDKFEEQHWWTSVTKAAQHGAVGWHGPKGERRKTALAESSGQAGGYVIPPQFQTELLTIAAEDGFIEQRAKVLPMNTRTVQWPMLDITTAQALGTSPYFAGILAQWQPEAASIAESEPAFRQTDWTAWDLVLYAVSSNQLLADNGIGLDALLTQLFGQAIVWYKEYAYLRGTGAGSSMPLGILNAGATYAQTRAVASRFTFGDVAAMMSHLQVRSWDDACWIMHQSVLPQLIQMVDGGTSNTASTTYIPGNRLVWLNPTMTGDRGPAASKMPNAFFNGLPVFFTEKLPTLGTKGDVMLVDFSRYIIGMRLDLQIDVSPHYKFQNNQLAWRVIARCDGKPWMNNTITDANGWTVSPIIVLN